MKRKTKNIIMILISVIVLLGIVLTIYFANNSLSSGGVEPNMGNMTMPSGDNGQNNGMQSGNNTPPEKPDGGNQTGDMQMPMENGDNSTPPEKPDSDNQNASMNGMQDGSTPPEKPDGEESGNMTMPSDGGQMPEQNGMNASMNNISANDSSLSLSIWYYVILITLSIIFSIIFMYLILSGFNAKSFKDTFSLNDKKIIYILAVIILSSGLSFGSIYASKNLNSKTDNNAMEQNGGMGQSSSASYSASSTIDSDEDIKDEKYSSDTSGENALLISGDVDVTLEGITASKTGDGESGDSSSFYGTNSAILAKSGADVTITGATITTSASGANGVFSYGGSATTNNSNSDGTTINIKNSSITTTADSSGGIMTTGGGITNAENLTITTSGVSSAAIRSDRGGGTVNVNKGTYTTNGAGSPAIYSTANITVKNAKLISNTSEGVVIEGKNSVTLNKCTLEDTNNKLNGQSTTYKNIFLYQSQSGDASDGTSVFTAKNSKITTNVGDTFYITNTKATIILENNTFVNNDEDGYFLRSKSDSWGQSGSNGGEVTLSMTNQDVEGSIYIDSVSTLDMTLTSSSIKGAINEGNTAKEINITLDKNSTLTLTGDSYVTSLTDKDTDYSNINFNGYKLYVNGTSIN